MKPVKQVLTWEALPLFYLSGQSILVQGPSIHTVTGPTDIHVVCVWQQPNLHFKAGVWIFCHVWMISYLFLQPKNRLSGTWLLSHANHLGFTVDYTKSTPAQIANYLGLDETRLLLIWVCLSLQTGRVAFSSFCNALGLGSGWVLPVPLADRYVKFLFQNWMNGLPLDPSWHRYKKVRISRQCHQALRPWRRASYNRRALLCRILPLEGSRNGSIAPCLGSYMAAQKRMGYPAETQEYKCAQTAGSFYLLRTHRVLIRTNGTSTLYHVGGTKSKQSLRVVQQLLTFAFPPFCSLRATWYEETGSRLTVLLNPTIRRVGDSIQKLYMASGCSWWWLWTEYNRMVFGFSEMFSQWCEEQKKVLMNNTEISKGIIW